MASISIAVKKRMEDEPDKNEKTTFLAIKPGLSLSELRELSYIMPLILF